MNILDQIKGENKSISVIKDPFSKDGITRISLFFWGDRSDPHWSGSVQFRNGMTKGEQNLPPCLTFDELIMHLKTVGESLK